MRWGWAPIAGPNPGEARPGEDGESWWWQVEARGQAPRWIEIRLSETLIHWLDHPEVAHDLREAVLTKGRSELVRVALWETPPIRIELDTAGRWRLGGNVVNPG
jgi:hypothetical protein